MLVIALRLAEKKSQVICQKIVEWIIIDGAFTQLSRCAPYQEMVHETADSAETGKVLNEKSIIGTLEVNQIRLHFIGCKPG